MKVGRAAGTVLLSIVDAFVPAAFVAWSVSVLVPFGFVDAPRSIVVPLTVGGVVFVTTVGFGLVSAVYRNRSFPVTRAVKRFVDSRLFRYIP